jgi:uncharacterized membrane protein YraQ (UPF0718 family)
LSEAAGSSPRRPGGWRVTVIWFFVVLAIAALCWWLKGASALETAAGSYADQMLVLLPRMSAALLISGFIQVLVPRGLVAKWLGGAAGFKGVFIAAGVGALTPGGPMLAFPLVVVLRNAGASNVSLITFLTSWSTLAFHRILMWELPLLGPEFAFVRYVSSIPLGIMAGLMVMMATSLTGRKNGEKS